MRQFFISVMMAVICWPAQAALSILTETRDGILYIDKEGAEKQGNILRVMKIGRAHV